ncbi:MAG TPA: acyltransferase, partial [Ilumatobacteraceae bacterium]|nr:acyltransferase [Ilumatobacteraceae bacterium]
MSGADGSRHEGRNGGLAYLPGLDGLRALAVAAVVAFHFGAGWATGGFLGVSLFFTLSGFLITRVLLAERSADGHVRLRGFWGRRIRRLTPAAMVCLAGVLVVMAVRGDAGHARQVGHDVLASAFNVANWHFVSSSVSYGDLFSGWRSPVLHFWSLAIEEQFYVLFPVLFVVVARWHDRLDRRGLDRRGLDRRGRRWRSAPAVVAVTVVGAILASVVASWLTADGDLVYFGTHTRAGELLIGVLLALAVEA